ncbi:MAG: group I truncated hemoglobin [Nocardioides sp.]
MQDEQHAHAVSDYDRIGGVAAVRTVVDRFYELILEDDRLVAYFTDTDLPRLKRHQVLLISQVLGGPAAYDGRELRQAHAGMAITPAHFGLVVEHLVQAMQEAGVDAEIIGRVGAVLAQVEPDVVTAAAG